MIISRRSSLKILAAGAVLRGSASPADEPPRGAVSLAGEWRFELDPYQKGLRQAWRRRDLLDRVSLPGTLETNGKGFLNTDYSTDGLTRKWTYSGYVWYQRDIDIPPSWAGRRNGLLLERTGASRIWIDDRVIGHADDLLMLPQTYEFGDAIAPGRHRLTIMVNGAASAPSGRGPFSGVLGRIELFSTDSVWIERVKVTPDLAGKRAKLSVALVNSTGSAVQGAIALEAHSFNSDRRHAPAPLRLPVEAPPGRSTVEGELPMGDGMLLWDEFQPALYRLAVGLTATGPGSAFGDRIETDFGMRDFTHDGPQLLVNGRPVILRGRSNSASSPLTGHQPFDVEGWRRYLRNNKQYGLNHLRAGAPPAAAFEAADMEGTYLQVELGARSPLPDPAVPAKVQSVLDAGAAVLDAYGNHPSFCLLALGNELFGDRNVHQDVVRRLRAHDGRHLFAAGSNNFYDNQKLQSGDDFWVTARTHRGASGLVRASMACHNPPNGHVEAGPPNTRRDYAQSLDAVPIPVIAHELGQYQVYPDYDEIPKFTGVLLPRNLEVFRERLLKAGMYPQWKDFFRASGALSVLCYKEDLEAAFRTPHFGGFQILDMADVHGEGTALVGILDVFNDSKGLISPEDWRNFCGPVVPLLRFDKYTWTAGETFTAEMQVAHYGAADLRDAAVVWTLKDGDGRLAQKGETARARIEQGRVSVVGNLSLPLRVLKTPARYELELAIRGTPFRNRWPVWVYPSSVERRPPGALTTVRRLDVATQQKLADGANVLLLPDPARLLASAVDGQFQSDFWSYSMFSRSCSADGMAPSPGTLGILTDPAHPALAQFPTESHTNWQWWTLIKSSRSVVLPMFYGRTDQMALTLDAVPAEYRPIVQVIDNVYRNQKLGLVFEFRVGSGRLLICTIDLPALKDRPEAAQMLHSLQVYAASPLFQPAHTVEFMVLKRLLGIDVVPDDC